MSRPKNTEPRPGTFRKFIKQKEDYLKVVEEERKERPLTKLVPSHPSLSPDRTRAFLGGLNRFAITKRRKPQFCHLPFAICHWAQSVPFLPSFPFATDAPPL